MPGMRKGGVNRGYGIYFTDDEREAIIREVGEQTVERSRRGEAPQTISGVVRDAVREYIERQRLRRSGTSE